MSNERLKFGSLRNMKGGFSRKEAHEEPKKERGRSGVQEPRNPEYRRQKAEWKEQERNARIEKAKALNLIEGTRFVVHNEELVFEKVLPNGYLKCRRVATNAKAVRNIDPRYVPEERYKPRSLPENWKDDSLS